jgi:hypothetical protein
MGGVKRFMSNKGIKVKEAIEILLKQDPEAILTCYDPEWGDYPAEKIFACEYQIREDLTSIEGPVLKRKYFKDHEGKDLALVVYSAVQIK